MVVCTSFFDNAVRITAPCYLPTEADVLRARIKTTGIYETRFQMQQLSIQWVLIKRLHVFLVLMSPKHV